MTVLTKNGILARVAEEWSGQACLERLVTRLRAPAYPHDTLVLGGTVTALSDGMVELEFTAAMSTGLHAETTAYVRPG